MNRRDFVKAAVALPVVSLYAPSAEADPEIHQWVYCLFDSHTQLGVAAEVRFMDPKLGLRQKRAAARFVLPEAKCYATDAVRDYPELVERAKQAVLKQLRTNQGVVYDDDTLEGNELRI